jgi:hypothetical protein
MRPLEVAAAIMLLPNALNLLSPFRDQSALFAMLPFVVALLIAWHLKMEGYRWQMIPAYCLSILFVAYECGRWLWAFRAPYAAGIAAVLLDLGAVILGTVLPVFKLPTPTGPHKIGTQIRHIVDERRHDPLSDHPAGARELMIQIWYPVNSSSGGAFALYRDKRITTFKDAHFALVKSHSLLGPPLARWQEKYPLVLYTPSWSGLRTESTAQVEELASHGYIVVGIDHPYSSRITVFPDGRIARRKFSGNEDYSSPSAVAAFVKTADQQVEIRARDASFVLDTLERLNSNDPQGLLTGRLDLDRIGIAGFSLGGGTAAEACWLDRRFRAGIDMGGMVAGQSAEQGTFSPFFFMFEGLYENPPFAPGTDVSSLEPRRRREVEFTRKQFAQIKSSLSEYGGYWLVIHGIKHRDFCDSPFFSPLRYGRVHPRRIVRIIRRYAVAFFDKHLKGIDQPLLDGATREIPEVRFQAWSATTPGAHPG